MGDVAEDNKEAVTLKVSQNTLTVATGSSLDKLMKRFSLWPQLVRSITWLMAHKSKRSVPPTANHGKIGLAETLAVSKAIVMTVQWEYLQEDLEALESGKPIKKDSKLSTLCLVLIDRAICVAMHQWPPRKPCIHW